MERDKSPWDIPFSWFHVENKISHTILYSSFVLHITKPVSMSNIIDHPEPGLETVGDIYRELLARLEVPGILVDNICGVGIKLSIEG